MKKIIVAAFAALSLCACTVEQDQPIDQQGPDARCAQGKEAPACQPGQGDQR